MGSDMMVVEMTEREQRKYFHTKPILCKYCRICQLLCHTAKQGRSPLLRVAIAETHHISRSWRRKDSSMQD